jgi:hypothetical protein
LVVAIELACPSRGADAHEWLDSAALDELTALSPRSIIVEPIPTTLAH